MYRGIYAGSDKIKNVFLGSEELYKSGYKSVSVRRISGASTSACFVDMGDYLIAISKPSVGTLVAHKLTKTSDALELVANLTAINTSYAPSKAWRRGTNEIIVVFTRNSSSAYGYIFAILNTDTWTFTTISDVLEDSEGGASGGTACYDATNDIVYFWKNYKLRTWKPSTNSFTMNSTASAHGNKLFIDVDGSLRTFRWLNNKTYAQVYSVVNGVEEEAYTIDTSEWSDEYAGFSTGFEPTSKGLAYLLTTDTLVEFNLKDRTAKGYPFDTSGLYYNNAWELCEKKGFLAVTVQNSSDIYLMVLE